MARQSPLVRSDGPAQVRRRPTLAAVLKAAAVVGLLWLLWWLKPYPAPVTSKVLEPSSLDPPGAPVEGTRVYFNDFNAPTGSSFPGWSSSPVAYSNRFGLGVSGEQKPQPITNVESPGGGRRFLGEFGGPRLDPTARTRVRQSVRLSLNDLGPHSQVTLSFDLLILKSWDGNSPQYGPDRWTVGVAGGPTLLDASFSNNPKAATENSFQDFPEPGSKPQQGAASRRTLGYTFFGDSVYHLGFTFRHTGPTLSLVFTGDLFEGKGTADESWGLDDVSVHLAGDAPAAPHPR